jgi:hypothetical protein
VTTGTVRRSRGIAALALLRVHVLVVELPGRPLLRLHAEAAVRARGWVVTTDPDDTDLVLVCGSPRPDVVAAVDALWRRVPVPRARRTIRAEGDLGSALDSAARVLADDALQRRSAVAAAPLQAPSATRLGPVGPLWPAGLVLDAAVDARDRVVAVGTRRLPAEAEEVAAAPVRLLIHPVADAARLLRLAGWAAPALRLERVADLALTGVPPERLRRRLRAVERSLRRSATLHRVLRREVPGIDVHQRVGSLLVAAIDGTEPPAAPGRALLGLTLDALPLAVAATEPVGPGG